MRWGLNYSQSRMMGKKKSGVAAFLPRMTPLLLAFWSCCVLSHSPSRRKLLDNGLGLTPPMGWSSWNRFRCDINETIVKQTADALVSTGLAELGYKYVNLDDCWGEKDRDAQGNLVANKRAFPSGIKALADYVHAKSLLLGIYSSSGTRTCTNKMPGSLGNEERDAATFASWGVDYLKLDNCYNDDTPPTLRFARMSRALNSTGRPIFFSMCEWGDMRPALWGASISNSWRTTDDITDNWSSMLKIADLNEFYAPHAKPGGWNDPDMLEVGNGGMKFSEYRVHYSIWSISKVLEALLCTAPLILGCDIRILSNDTMEIISNPEVIAVNQDPLGIQADKKRSEGERDIWGGPLSGNRTVVLFVNRKPWVVTLVAHWDDLGILSDNIVMEARDLWEQRTLNKTFQGSLEAKVDPHSCKLYVLKPASSCHK